MLIRLFILTLLLLPHNTYANISVFPQSLDFETSNPKRVQSIRVINSSNQTQTYRVSLVNFVQNSNGRLVNAGKDETNFANKYLAFSPRQFTLRPNDMQTIHVARKAMPQTTNGEYISHLKISEVYLGETTNKSHNKNDYFSVKLKPVFAVTLPVTIYKGDKLLSKTGLVDYKFIKPNILKLKLKRLGNISSRINVVVLDKNSQTVGLVKNLKIYPPLKELSFDLPLKNISSGNGVIIKLENAKTEKEILSKAVTL